MQKIFSLILLLNASYATRVLYNLFVIVTETWKQRRNTEQWDVHKRGASCFCQEFELIQWRGQESSADIVKDDQRILQWISVGCTFCFVLQSVLFISVHLTLTALCVVHSICMSQTCMYVNCIFVKMMLMKLVILNCIKNTVKIVSTV